MTAQIIDIPVVRVERNIGNGAREALIDLAMSFPNTDKTDAMRWCDFMLAEFWARGFKVVPVESDI